LEGLAANGIVWHSLVRRQCVHGYVKRKTFFASLWRGERLRGKVSHDDCIVTSPPPLAEALLQKLRDG
jgi:hypothetical protein